MLPSDWSEELRQYAYLSILAEEMTITTIPDMREFTLHIIEEPGPTDVPTALPPTLTTPEKLLHMGEITELFLHFCIQIFTGRLPWISKYP